MATPDSNLGISVNFPEEQFRNAIHFAMQMGKNPDETRQAVFIVTGTGRTFWKNDVLVVGTPRLDRDGMPLDPEIEVRHQADTEIKRDCAIEVVRADAEELPVGNFRPTKCVVTLLDDDYQAVKAARRLRYNGDEYLFGYEPESEGLFEVGVYTMIFYALDES